MRPPDADSRPSSPGRSPAHTPREMASRSRAMRSSSRSLDFPRYPSEPTAACIFCQHCRGSTAARLTGVRVSRFRTLHTLSTRRASPAISTGPPGLCRYTNASAHSMVLGSCPARRRATTSAATSRGGQIEQHQPVLAAPPGDAAQLPPVPEPDPGRERPGDEQLGGLFDAPGELDPIDSAVSTRERGIKLTFPPSGAGGGASPRRGSGICCAIGSPIGVGGPSDPPDSHQRIAGAESVATLRRKCCDDLAKALRRSRRHAGSDMRQSRKCYVTKPTSSIHSQPVPCTA